MKRIFFLLIAANGALSAIAQTSSTTTTQADNSKHHHRYFKNDSLMKRWVFDFNLLGGGLTRTMNVANTYGNYTNGIAGNNTGTLNFKNGVAYGADAQLGYFFGKKGHFGLGLGLSYLQEQGDLTLENFHVQYQSTASNGDVFRQVITANKMITEKITATNVSIPLLLKYKVRFSKRFGFTADAGILYNLEMRNDYKTDASFDYEAIYQFAGTGGNGRPTVYDNSVTPGVNDYLITKSSFMSHNPEGNLGNYFQSQHAQGYNVGLGVMPNNNSGTVSYLSGSVGFLFRPCLNYFLSDWCALNIGGYVLYQPFNNNVPSNYKLTDVTGTYTTSANSVSSGSDLSYGGNLGIRFLFGERRTPLTISYVDQSDPTACGACDGTVTLYGLPAGRNVTVTYSMNGISQTGYSGTVASDGTVKLTNLCAGYYTDINARLGRRTAMATSVVLSDPIIKITAVTSTNPTVIGTCNGSITIKGINSGRTVTVSYNYNGTAATPYTGVAAPDGSVKLSDLCAGSYSGIVVSGSNCSTNAPNDITLVAPPPPPVEKPRQPAIDPSTPILFDLGKTQIHESSLDILEEAVLELNDNKNSYVIIDGHTDDIGTPSSNRVLSYKRAQAVKEYLKEMGIDEKRLITVGHGEEQPIAPNTSSEGRAKNRRVIMTLRKHE
jgi:outer membrane protein OmpA-like peptidoglycan-associated protein